MGSVNIGPPGYREIGHSRECTDEAARLFPQQRGIPGPDRAEIPKGLAAEHLPHHLRKGEQCASHLAINPWLVPTLENEAGAILTQSLAIIEWLDETHPEPPLLPKDRCAPRCAFALAVACDIHPVHPTGRAAAAAWFAGRKGRSGRFGSTKRRGLVAQRRWIADESAILLRRHADHRRSLPVPQLANARRFGVDVSAYPRLLEAEAAAKEMKAFADAAPDKQPDAE